MTGLRSPEERLSAGLRWSLIIHGALLMTAFMKTVVFPGKPVTLLPTLRVDIVALPDVLKKDLKLPSSILNPAPPSPPPQKKSTSAPEEKAAPDEMVLKPSKVKEASKQREKKLKSALNRIKALEKIASENEPPKEKAAPLIKGNKISKGTSLSADALEAATASYYDTVRDRMQEKWELPIWLSRQQNLSAKVMIFIDSRGKIRSFHFVKNSGNAQFDDEVKRTLQQSQPYPPPPPGEIASKLLTDGILVGFPL